MTFDGHINSEANNVHSHTPRMWSQPGGSRGCAMAQPNILTLQNTKVIRRGARELDASPRRTAGVIGSSRPGYYAANT